MRLDPLLILNTPAQFKTVRDAGKSWHTPHFILSCRLGGKDETVQRIGFILTKKIGMAVARNRIRRRLRVIARELLPAEAAPGDYVIIPKTTCLDAATETLKKDMLWALKRLSAQKQTDQTSNG